MVACGRRANTLSGLLIYFSYLPDKPYPAAKIFRKSIIGAVRYRRWYGYVGMRCHHRCDSLVSAGTGVFRGQRPGQREQEKKGTPGMVVFVCAIPGCVLRFDLVDGFPERSSGEHRNDGSAVCRHIFDCLCRYYFLGSNLGGIEKKRL